MIEDILHSLIEEFNIDSSLAMKAIEQSDGDHDSAREYLLLNYRKYFFMKVRYLEAKIDKGGGLILAAIERNAPGFLLLQTMVDSTGDFITAVNIISSPEIVNSLFHTFFATNPSASKFNDSNSLYESLLSNVNTAEFNGFFEFAVERKPDLAGNGVTATVADFITRILEEILYRRVSVDADVEFLNQLEFDAIKSSLGFGSEDEEVEQDESSAGAKTKAHPRFDVALKGHLIIDPINGQNVDDLSAGDPLYVDVVERSDTAVKVATALGFYRKGVWYPARGTILDLKEFEDGRKRFSVALARGVTVNVPAMKSIKVKTNGEKKKVARRTGEGEDVSNPMPLLIAVILMAAFVVILLMIR